MKTLANSTRQTGFGIVQMTIQQVSDKATLKEWLYLPATIRNLTSESPLMSE